VALLKKVNQESTTFVPWDFKTLTDFSVCDFFYLVASTFPNKPFIKIFDGERITYSEGAARVFFTIKKLEETGVSRGDLVGCYSESPLPYLYFFLACTFIGAIPVPLSPLFSVDYLKTVLSKANAKWVFCEEPMVEILQSAGLEPFHYSSQVGNARSNAISLKEKMEERFMFLGLKQYVSKVGPDDPLMVQTTSGSTGEPKLVLRKHKGLTHYAKHLGRELHESKQFKHPRYLMLLSMAHSLGYHQFTSGLSLAAEFVVPMGLDASVRLEQVKALDPEIMPMPPRVLRSFVAQANGGQIFGPSAKVIICAGGKGDLSNYKILHSQNIETMEIYSTSETAMIALTPWKGWKEGFAGVVLEEVSLKVAPDGELLAQSPGVMLEYLQEEQATREAFTDENYFKTGDIGSIDEGKWVQILGRKKDVFNTPEGSNIFPARIESFLEALPWVHQAILVGDGRPYLTCLVTLKEMIAGGFKFLPRGSHSNIYAKASVDILQINSKLENIEHVLKFAIFSGEFDNSVYGVVGGAKVKRNRSAIQRQFGEIIDMLYNPYTEVMVDSRDLRLRPRR
jgi:long-chain acyl-CoA synthetase